MPILSDLRESGSIEQDADEVMFLMRPEYYGFTEEVEIAGVMYSPKDLVIAKAGKNRHGPTENFALTFNGPTMHFRNRENPNENYNNGQPNYTQPSIGFMSVNGDVDDMPF